MCVSILSILSPTPIRTHDLAPAEYDCRSETQEIASNEEHGGDEADQVDEIQAVRVPRSVCPPRRCGDTPLTIIGMM